MGFAYKPQNFLLVIKYYMNSRISYLIRKIKYYDYQWYHNGIRVVSDQHVEALRKELLELEKQTGYFRPDSPSINIGYVDASLRTVTHIPTMLSLNKTYDIKQIGDFINKYKEHGVIAQPKLDGAAMSIIYIGGILDSISLRGNGKEGEDVLHQLHIIENIPYEISLGEKSSRVVIRGEVIALDDSYRNIVSGLLNRKTNSINKKVLKFIAYEIVEPIMPTKVPLIENMICVDTWEVNNENLHAVIENIKAKNKSIDGIVFKIKDNHKYQELGYTRRFPHGAIAFKISSASVFSKIKSIDWSMGRSYQLIPTAVIEPVKIGNSNIEKVYLYNLQFLIDNEIGIGAEISIEKTGDVVPTIVNVIKTSPVTFPENCLFCNSKTHSEKPHLYCSNLRCPRVLQEKTIFFFNQINLDYIYKKYIYEQNQTCLLDMIKNVYYDNSYNKSFIKMQKSLHEKILLISPRVFLLSLEYKNKSIVHIESWNDLLDFIKHDPEHLEIFNFINKVINVI